MKDLTFGTYLTQAREAHGLGQAQLARLVGVARSQVTRWERGDLTPTAESLMSLATQLELPASDLFRIAGRPVPADVLSIPAMLRAEYELPPAAVKEIEDYIAVVATRYDKHLKQEEEL